MKKKLAILKKLPLLSQGHSFVFGECDNGLVQGDRVELRFCDNPWIPAIVGGLGGMFKVVFVVDLVLREKHYFSTKKHLESSEEYDFRFVGRSNNPDIDFSKSVSSDQLLEALNSF